MESEIEKMTENRFTEKMLNEMPLACRLLTRISRKCRQEEVNHGSCNVITRGRGNVSKVISSSGKLLSSGS